MKKKNRFYKKNDRITPVEGYKLSGKTSHPDILQFSALKKEIQSFLFRQPGYAKITEFFLTFYCTLKLQTKMILRRAAGK